jgi:hypothetical protein
MRRGWLSATGVKWQPLLPRSLNYAPSKALCNQIYATPTTSPRNESHFFIVPLFFLRFVVSRRVRSLHFQRFYSQQANHQEGNEQENVLNTEKSPKHKAKKGQTERTLRNMFLLRTHPDLFTSEPQQRALNQKSLKTLNFLIAAVKDEGKGLTDATYELHFFCKMPDGNAQEARVLFELPALFNSKDKSASTQGSGAAFLKKRLDQCIEELYVQAGVLERRVSAFGADQPDQLEPETRGWATFRWAKNTRKLLLEKLRENMKSDVVVPYDQELQHFVRHELIFFSQLTKAQQKAGMERFMRKLAEIDFEHWRDVPLLLGRRYSREVEGFVIIPYNFKVDDVRAYLDAHLPAILTERKKLQREARLLHDLTIALKQDLNVQDISIWGPKRKAIPCLQNLVALAPQLKAYDWRHTNIVIQDDPPLPPPPSASSSPSPNSTEEVKNVSSSGTDHHMSTQNPQIINENLTGLAGNTPGRDGGLGGKEGGSPPRRPIGAFWVDERLHRLYVGKTFVKEDLLLFLEGRQSSGSWPWKLPLIAKTAPLLQS